MGCWNIAVPKTPCSLSCSFEPCPEVPIGAAETLPQCLSSCHNAHCQHLAPLPQTWGSGGPWVSSLLPPMVELGHRGRFAPETPKPKSSVFWLAGHPRWLHILAGGIGQVKPHQWSPKHSWRRALTVQGRRPGDGRKLSLLRLSLGQTGQSP